MFLTEDHSRIPPEVATKIKKIVWDYAISYDNVDDFRDHGKVLAMQLTNMLVRAGFDQNLQIRLFDVAKSVNGSDAYASNNIVTFTKEFLQRFQQDINPLYMTNRPNRVALREFTTVMIHELTHIKQYANGMPSREDRKTTLTFDFKYWFAHLSDETKKPTYDYHTISHTELQVIGSQLAHEAMLKLQDWVSDDMDEIYSMMGTGDSKSKFNNFINKVMDLTATADGTATYRDALTLRRLDGTPFSHKDPVEHRALVLLYRSFVKTLNDWFYGHDPDQAKYDKAVADRKTRNANREYVENPQVRINRNNKNFRRLTRHLLVDKLQSRQLVRLVFNNLIRSGHDFFDLSENRMFSVIAEYVPFEFTNSDSFVDESGKMHISTQKMRPIFEQAKHDMNTDDGVNYAKFRDNLNHAFVGEMKKIVKDNRQPWGE